MIAAITTQTTALEAPGAATAAIALRASLPDGNALTASETQLPARMARPDRRHRD
jgi:hypothetical protein